MGDGGAGPYYRDTEGSDAPVVCLAVLSQAR